MNTYFRLHVYCKYIKGKKDEGCIYNMVTHQMLYIEGNKSVWLEIAEKNELLPVGSEDFFKMLYENQLGSYYNYPVYIEHLRNGKNPEVEKVIIPRTTIKKIFIQVTNDCNLSCVYCNSDNKLYRKLGCKRWDNKITSLNSNIWWETLQGLYNLECRELHFIGGNPLLELEKIKELICIGKKIGYEKFSISANIELINDKMIQFLITHNIILYIELNTFKDNTFRRINIGKTNSYAYNNLLMLINRGIVCNANILISRYNENEIKTLANELKNMTISYNIDYIYIKPSNTHYSKNYIDEMYNKSNNFGLVTKESVAFLHDYNSSLYGQLYINLTGNVTPHPMINDIVLGNICTDSITAIAGGDKYRSLIHLSRNKIENCSSCALKDNCYDSRAIEYSATGKINGQEFCNKIDS